MQKLKKYFIPILSGLILIFNFWYIFELFRGFSYIKEIRANVDLLEKYIWINLNISIFLIICNSFFIAFLSLMSCTKILTYFKNKYSFFKE
ncbi:hypothetical protein OA86_05495 [Kaistella jeonii]|uniref:Uncharacterized protein n=1 Tax=Kaistella jeonii TaxID=266749 RepID=A0A0C1D032_9FLAO|nr:hypothetical protein OA86_05495 [Kaistella jeonii]